jgi:hypothetical protein
VETTKTPSVKAELLDPSIENTQPEICNLSILFQKDGLVFSILRNDVGKYIVLGEYESTGTEADLPALFAFTQQLQGPFAEVHLGYYTPKFTLIPQSLYRADHAETYAEFQFTLDEDEVIKTDVLSTHGLVVLYAVKRPVADLLEELFEFSKPRHAATFTISYYLDQYKNKPGEHIHVHLWHQHLEITAIQSGRLQVCSSFDFETDEDVLYFILNVYEQLDFNPEAVPVKLAGDIAKGTRLWQLLETYIRYVEVEDRPKGQYSHEFKNVPVHRYNRVFQAAQCA